MKSALVAEAAAESRVAAAGALGLDLGGQASARSDERAQVDLADRGARILVIVLFSFMAVRIARGLSRDGPADGPAPPGERGAGRRLHGPAPCAGDRRSQRAGAGADRALAARPAAGDAVAHFRRSPPRSSPSACRRWGCLSSSAARCRSGAASASFPPIAGSCRPGCTAWCATRSTSATSITHVAFVAANPTLWNYRAPADRGHRAPRARGLRRAHARARRRLPPVSDQGALAGRARVLLEGWGRRARCRSA